MASREEVSRLGEVNGVRSRVDMEDYDTPENNGRRPAVLAADGGMSPDALDYESTDDDSTLTQPADDVRFGTASAAGVPVTGATRGEVAYDRAAAQASVYESNTGKVPDAEKGANDAPKDVEKSDEIEATKAEIEHTRAELSETIDAIKEKLSPAHLVAEAKEATVGAASDAVHHVVDAVKDKASDTVHGVMDSVKDKATSVLDVVKGKAAIAVDAAKGAGQMIADKVSQARTNNDGGTGVNATSGNAPVVASSSATLSASPITYHDRTGTLAAASGGHSLGATIVDTIKVNPLPAAIAGFGLGWLLLSIQRQSKSSAFVSGGSGGSFRPHEDYGRDYAVPDLTPRTYTSDTYATAANVPLSGSGDNGSGPGLKEKASNLASGVADKASGLASGVAGKASDLTHNVADKASGLASTVSETASNVAGSVTAKASDLAHAASDTASSLKDKASTLAVGAKDKATDLAHGIGDKASDLKETTKVQYRAASESIGGFVEEQPLVAGALAILAGAALGYLLPGTEKENRLIGPKRDQLMEKAGDAVQNVAHKVQTVAETALGQAKESLSETVEVAKDQLQHAVEETKQSVKNEVKGQGLNSPATAIS